MKIKNILIILFGLSITANAQQKVIESLQRPHLIGICKAAFFTKDTGANHNFYSNYLGFAGMDFGEHFNTVIKINSRQCLELIPEKITGGNRLSHFSVETNDAEAMRKYLFQKKIVVPKVITKDTKGNRFFFITDPNGTVCEFIQYKKETITTKKNSWNDSSIAQHMSHVGFMVADVDKAIDFYCGVLGFTETWRGSKDGKNVTWVNLKVPDGRDYIELMLYDKEQSDENMGVLNHICLEVDDVTVSAQTLKNRTLPKGCKQTTAMKTGINKKRQINCYDIDGTRVEIMEAQTSDGQPAPSSTAIPLKFVVQRQL